MGKGKKKKGVPLMMAESPRRYRAEYIVSRGSDGVSKDRSVERREVLAGDGDLGLKYKRSCRRKGTGIVSNNRQ